jgi:hypothetical protein
MAWSCDTGVSVGFVARGLVSVVMPLFHRWKVGGVYRRLQTDGEASGKSRKGREGDRSTTFRLTLSGFPF